MESQKNNKGVIGVLVAVIILLLCAVLYLLFGKDMMNDKTESNSTTTTTNTNITQKIDDSYVYYKDKGKIREEKNIEENLKQNENILNTLNKKSFNDLKPVYECTNESNCSNFVFNINNKTIYVNNGLSLNKNDNNNAVDYQDIFLEVYKISDYYILLDHATAGDGGSFKVYDNDINLVYAAKYEDGVIYYSDNTIYYGVGACEILRPDNRIGMGIVVYEYNIVTRSNKYLFNLNHDAGWAC